MNLKKCMTELEKCIELLIKSGKKSIDFDYVNNTKSELEALVNCKRKSFIEKYRENPFVEKLIDEYIILIGISLIVKTDLTFNLRFRYSI